MRDRSFSDEEQRQREKEERSRLRKQKQAYREAQRGVRPPQEEYQDYRDDPRDRLYDDRRPPYQPPVYDREPYYQEPYYEEPWEEDSWEEERRRVQESFREAEAPPPRRPAPPPEDEWRPLYQEAPAPAQERRPPRPEGDKPPKPRLAPPRRPAPPSPKEHRPPRRKGRRRKAVVAILLVLLALAALGVLAHQIFVRPPALPEETGTHPTVAAAGRKEEVYTFLLVGRDDGEGGGGNTDTLMVGSFDVKNGTVDVLSIYRDTMVDIPVEIPKINGVYNRYGLEGLQTQIKNLIGYVPDYYFVVELDAVAEMVDAIGGVTYDVPYNMDYDDPAQDLHIHFQKGEQHLNGEDAVKVLRWRKNNSGESLSVGDVGRVQVQHSFLNALAGEMMSLGTLFRLGDIVNVVDRNLESNLSYGEMIWFGERLLTVDKENIRFHNLPGDYTGTQWSRTYQNYQSYVFVNSAALRELVNQYMNPYLEEITAEMQHVVNDTTVNNMPAQAAAPTGQPTE